MHVLTKNKDFWSIVSKGIPGTTIHYFIIVVAGYPNDKEKNGQTGLKQILHIS